MDYNYTIDIEQLFIKKPVISLDEEPSYVYINNIRHIRSLKFNNLSLVVRIPSIVINISTNPVGRTFIRLDIEVVNLLLKLVKVIEKSLNLSIGKHFRINGDTGSLFINMCGIDEYVLTTVKDIQNNEISIDNWGAIKNIGCVADISITGLRYETGKANPDLVTELINITIDDSSCQPFPFKSEYRKTINVRTILDLLHLEHNVIEKLKTYYDDTIVLKECLSYHSKTNWYSKITKITDETLEVLIDDIVPIEEDNVIPGYIYLVTPEKYIGTSILKVGMTEQDPMDLKKRYKKNCKFHTILPSKSARDTETILLRLFNEKYEKAFTREYFIGDVECMIYDMIHIVGCFKL
eukprot:TRINITY_DN9392_c0_g1_i1.p1 TRINITY_DN9392_c0_g1~~TRINITY_DN9392_c0_g1_i1.p1  ORF type:complete len:351 (-),score=38.23 TRINITY_DN9392_c0_g1_i1:216-1268(-)